MERPTISDQSMFYLAEARKWAKLLVVVLYVIIALMILLGSIYLMIGEFGMYSALMTSAIGIMYIIVSIIWIIPARYLSIFSGSIKRSLQSGDEAELTRAFRYLRAHLRYIGIWMIIGIALSVLGVIAAIFAGIFGFFGGSGY